MGQIATLNKSNADIRNRIIRGYEHNIHNRQDSASKEITIDCIDTWEGSGEELKNIR